MKKFFSIDSIAKKSALLAKRFPISVLFLTVLAFLLFLHINDPASKELSFKLYIFFSFGAIISTVAMLYLEDYFGYSKQYIINAALMALWGVYCFLLPDEGNFHIDKIIELVAIGTVAFLSLFSISFLKKDNNGAYWNFSMQNIEQFILASWFGVIIYGGLCIAVLAVAALFDIKISKVTENIYLNLAVACFVLFVPIYFLANIPDKIAKYDEKVILSKHLKILALYILTPLAAVYAVILYAYLFTIIFAWELPKGLVSWLVSALACSGLLIITLLYPACVEAKNKFIVFLSRYFGLIILPLLVLMSIGIFRRLSDYGITINRCYVCLLNIWFYGIYIYLFIAKRQGIKWILISASAVFLLASIGFWNIPSITKRVIISELNEYLGGQKIFISDLQSIKDKDKILKKMRYLKNNYGIESVKPFFNVEITNNTISELELELTREKHIDEKLFSYYNDRDNKIMRTEKYNSFAKIDFYYNYDEKNKKELDYSFENNQLTIKIIPSGKIIIIPFREVALSLIEKEKDNEEKVFQGNDYIAYPLIFDGYYKKDSDSISLHTFRGYLFYNE
jgi:hypothetical protein